MTMKGYSAFPKAHVLLEPNHSNFLMSYQEKEEERKKKLYKFQFSGENKSGVKTKYQKN